MAERITKSKRQIASVIVFGGGLDMKNKWKDIRKKDNLRRGIHPPFLNACTTKTIHSNPPL